MNEKGQYWTILFPFFLYWRLVFPSTVDHQWRSLGRTATPSVGTSNVGSASTIFFVSKCPLDLHIRRIVDRWLELADRRRIFLKLFWINAIYRRMWTRTVLCSGWVRSLADYSDYSHLTDDLWKLWEIGAFFQFFEICFISAICRVTAELNSWFA